MPIAVRDYRYRWDPGIKVVEESLGEEIGREDAEALVEVDAHINAAERAAREGAL